MILPARAPSYRRFGLFLLAGGANTAFAYAAFATFILLGLRPALAAFGSTIAGILFNFRSFGLVFQDRDPRRFARFLAVYALLFVLNLALLRLLIGGGLPALAAQAFALPPLAILSFLLMRGFVFAQPPTRESCR